MKDCTTCKYGYEDEQLGIPMCHNPKRFSEDCVDFNMHEEKETEESKKPVPNDIDFEQELYKHFGQVKDFTLGMRIGKYFYELGQQSKEQPICEDVEEAAENYAYGESNDKYQGFVDGASWQKEQMMMEAVEGEVVKDISNKLAVTAKINLDGFKFGDKVRIIICKKED